MFRQRDLAIIATLLVVRAGAYMPAFKAKPRRSAQFSVSIKGQSQDASLAQRTQGPGGDMSDEGVYWSPENAAYSYAPIATATNGEQREDEGLLQDLWTAKGPVLAQELANEPSAEMSAEDVVVAVLRGLQYPDVPKPDQGLLRCYNFMDLPCKKLVTGYGNVPEERTLEKFLGYARESAKLTPFMGCATLQFGELTLIPATATRGEIACMAVRVRPSVRSKLQFDSGFERTNIHPGAKFAAPHTFMIRLQRQRRPPLSGVFLITDLVDVATVASVARPLNCE